MDALLGLAEWIGSRSRSKTDLRAGDGGLIGLAQVLAVIPGVSRSGSTITANLLPGLRREDAARFNLSWVSPPWPWPACREHTSCRGDLIPIRGCPT